MNTEKIYDTDEDSEELVTPESMEPPIESRSRQNDNIFFNLLWMFFELITIFKDFYDISLKPAFNYITNGYFVPRVTTMYKGIHDIISYTTIEAFLSDYYFHPPYKFMIAMIDKDNGANKKYVVKSDGQEVSRTFFDHHYKVSNASILMLRACIPGTDEKIDINLKVPDNYLVVGNTLDHNFVAWYLMKYCEVAFEETDILQTKLEYMNSSYQVETVDAPYEISVKEKHVEIYSIDLDSADKLDSQSQHWNEVSKDEYFSDSAETSSTHSAEEKEEVDEDSVDIMNERQHHHSDPIVPSFPSLAPVVSGSGKTNNIHINEEEEEGSDVSLEKKVTKNKKPSVHFSIEETKENKKRKGKKKKKEKEIEGSDTCTCGVCGEDFHISELNEYLLCQQCT